METISLKALARKVLERNRRGNSTETKAKSSGNFEGKNRGVSFHDTSGIFDDFYIKQKTGTGRTIYLTPKREIMERHRKEGEAWFLANEIIRLKGLESDSLERIIDVKEVFTGSEVIQ